MPNFLARCLELQWRQVPIRLLLRKRYRHTSTGMMPLTSVLWVPGSAPAPICKVWVTAAHLMRHRRKMTIPSLQPSSLMCLQTERITCGFAVETSRPISPVTVTSMWKLMMFVPHTRSVIIQWMKRIRAPEMASTGKLAALSN